MFIHKCKTSVHYRINSSKSYFKRFYCMYICTLYRKHLISCIQTCIRLVYAIWYCTNMVTNKCCWLRNNLMLCNTYMGDPCELLQTFWLKRAKFWKCVRVGLKETRKLIWTADVVSASIVYCHWDLLHFKHTRSSLNSSYPFEMQTHVQYWTMQTDPWSGSSEPFHAT